MGPSGIYLNDKIADIKLDGLVLKDNQITLDIGYLKPPEFKIDTMIDFFGVEENAEVKFKEGIFEIVLQQKIHDLFEADFLLAFGVDVHDGGMPLVYMAGQVSEGFDSWHLKKCLTSWQISSQYSTEAMQMQLKKSKMPNKRFSHLGVR